MLKNNTILTFDSTECTEAIKRKGLSALSRPQLSSVFIVVSEILLAAKPDSVRGCLCISTLCRLFILKKEKNDPRM